MRRRSGLTRIAVALALILSIAPAAAQTSSVRAEGRVARAPEAKRVTLELKDVPLAEAVRLVVAATDLSVLVVGEIPDEPRVTMRLADSDPIAVLRLLATAGMLDFDAGAMRSDQVPVVLLLRREAVRGSFARSTTRPSRASEAEPTPASAGLIEINAAVDLDVSNVSFREAIAEIAKQVPVTDPVRIVVDDSVPQELRVTARVRKMRLNWVLDSLIEQANLTYGLQDEVDPAVVRQLEQMLEQGLTTDVAMRERLVATASRVRTIYIVPKPELRVMSGGEATSD